MRIGKRITASCMAAVLLSANVAAPVRAAAPQIQVDETMYVNADYYGRQSKINVVKGCTTNGVEDYTDYGVYDKVVNMTSDEAPVMGDGTVTWKLPDKNERFYYQCTLPQTSVVLPWSFDVSYKLNGAEIDPSKLAGASGLIEIHVKAEPNKNAKAYYRNNMMLSVVVPVDMSKCYSVDAPGSQLQTVGNQTVALFAALPGEEGDFTVRIGTDSFESVGVVMMMVPATAGAFDHIKDLKDAEDTWRKDGDTMYDSINGLMKTMESMKIDVSQLKGGLGSLQKARESVSQNRKQIEALSTQAIAEFASVTAQTTVLIPYLEVARNAVSDINYNVDALYSTMGDTQDELDDLYSRLRSLSNSLRNTSDLIAKGITPEEQQALAKDIQTQTAQIQGLIHEMEQLLSAGTSSYKAAGGDLKKLNKALDKADAFRYDRKLQKATASDALASDRAATTSDAGKGSEASLEASSSTDGGPSGEPGSGGVNDADFDEWSDQDINSGADDVEENLQTLSGTPYPAAVKAMLEQISQMIGDGSQMTQKAGAVINKINGISASVGATGVKAADTLHQLRDVTDELVSLLDDSRSLIDTVDGYVPDMLDCLGATQELMNRLTRTMGTTHDFLSLVNDTAISAGDSLDAGTKDSLNGMISLLDKSLKALDDTAAVRQASEGMKNTVDEQLDKFEDENNFLNIDPEEDLVSFTSGKNPSPHSIQILVRTDEISLKDNNSQVTDMESGSSENLGPFQRIWRVIEKIFQSIVEIFKER